jgi:hypothetical protein
MTFVSTKEISYQNQGFNGDEYRALFDKPLSSTHFNYVGNLIDSVFLFGGANGAVGSIFDGTSGKTTLILTLAFDAES